MPAPIVLMADEVARRRGRACPSIDPERSSVLLVSLLAHMSKRKTLAAAVRKALGHEASACGGKGTGGGDRGE